MSGPPLSPVTLPPAFGVGAFRGTVLDGSTPVADRSLRAPAPFGKPGAPRMRPVYVTDASAGNRLRLGVVGTLREWWRFRGQMSGEFFVANSEQFHRLPNRRMSRKPMYRKVVPNVRGVYRARTYGGARSTVETS